MRGIRGRNPAAGAATAVSFLASPAWGHAFGQRYDLPVPLWLYLAGAGATVALTLALLALFVREKDGVSDYPRFNLLGRLPGRLLAHRYAVTAVRLVSVALFLLVVVAGFFGTQSPIRNIAPTMVWVIWWVGMAFVSALLGDLWALISPWNAIFAWIEAGYRRLKPGRAFGPGLAYPRWLGAWPAVGLFVAFAWSELVWNGGETPANIARMAVAYSLVTWAGMFAFGREIWLREGEVFAIAFGLLARFAPLELRVTDAAVCCGCGAERCRERPGECVNCYACFARAGTARRQWNLRPYAVGLVSQRPVRPAMGVFVLAMLATVSFDGFIETPAWAAILDWIAGNATLRPLLLDLRATGVDLLVAIKTLGLMLAPVLFLTVYLVFGRVMAYAVAGANGSAGERRSTGEMCRLFVLSLVPIAIAYHLAHYLSFLLLAGQLVIPLASDPFGFGWNLFGTVDYAIDISVVSARLVWFVAVVTVVLGHVFAVYIAHMVALATFRDARRARRSQYPMLVLMVGYTMISLWILAQPVVQT
ncbi:MAG: hypothetical protein ACE5H8_11605 [Alphaproteobacteria bacterium]